MKYFKPDIKKIFSFLLPLIILTPIVIFVKINCPPIIVVGRSMYPTYKNGEILIGTTKFDVKREMVVTANIPKSKDYQGGMVIKRIIAIGGDKVKIIGNDLYINDVLYTSDDSFSLKDGYEITLKENEIFLLGDNYGKSYDSREYGPITINELRYKVTDQRIKNK